MILKSYIVGNPVVVGQLGCWVENKPAWKNATDANLENSNRSEVMCVYIPRIGEKCRNLATDKV